MTLDILLQELPSITELKKLFLVFSSEIHDVLLNALATLPPNRQHQIKAIQLTDGRWFLGADILSEIGQTGIFKNGFTAVPGQYFSQVDVLPWEDVKGLLKINTSEI
jgi:hypothetical protein